MLGATGASAGSIVSGMPPRLAVTGVRKRFNGVEALAGVDVEFHAGEIHAVLGENGAGKSTLMYVLGGFLSPDSGRICIDGSAVAFATPQAARAAGIGMVHQHFTLVEALTVAENLALSLLPQAEWRLDMGRVVTDATVLARRVGLELSPLDAPVAELPVGARQRLEILKALAGTPRVMILDEPTAVLTPLEVGQLFTILRELRAQGCVVIFITHKLREVVEVADRVTVMRRGRVVLTQPSTAVTESVLAEQMVGDVVPVTRRVHDPVHHEVVLRVAQLRAVDARGVEALTDLSFTVDAGEILGIAGVDGNGQRELFEILSGVRRPQHGSVEVGGQRLGEFTPRAALSAGIGHIPPDRQRDGLVLPMSVHENCLLHCGVLARFSRHGFLRRTDARHFTAELVRRYGIRMPAIDAPVRLLSGGNQQRVVVARELAQQPRVLVASNPTRGLDIAASAAVAEALVDIAQRGCAVVLISTDLDEILDLSDRIHVLSRGRLSPPLQPPVERERLGLLMGGSAG